MTKNCLILLLVLIYANSNSQNFDLQGHRGARGLLPENSIPGFIKALDLGVTTIELDVVITGDGKVLVSHEPWFNSAICLDPKGSIITRGWDHNIYKMTYEEIKDYDCGSLGNPNYSEQVKIKISKPLLSEVIESVESHIQNKTKFNVQYNIEIKSDSKTDNNYHPGPSEFSELVFEVVDSMLSWQRVTIQSFDMRVLNYWHENHEEVTISFLTENSLTIKENLKNLGFKPDIYSPEHIVLKEEDIKDLHTEGIKLIPWTVNKKEDMQALIDWGVDGLITDYPDRAASLGLGIEIPYQEKNK
jgi:glycerophosphoryl diester phosphodiesterase